MEAEGTNERSKRKRQVKTKPVEEVSGFTTKLSELEKQIKELRKRNLELERKLLENSSSIHTPTIESENSIRFSLNDIKTIIPEFDPGKPSSPHASTWISNLESLKSIYLWDDRMMLFYATARLAGAAATWYAGKHFNEWTKFRTEIIRSFPSFIDTSSILYQIMTRKRKIDECIESYFYDIVSLGRKINLPDESIIKHIISNINNSNLSTVLMSINRKELSLDELLLHIKQCEEISKTEKQSNVLINDKIQSEGASTSRKPFNRNPNYSNRYQPYKNVKQSTTINSEKRCFKCNRKGHLANACSIKTELKCYKCDKVGHFARNCNLIIKKINVKDSNLKNEYFKIVLLEGHPIIAFLDLGSECTTLKESVARDMKVNIEKCNNILQGFGGTSNKAKGKTTKFLKVDDYEFEVDIMIVEDHTQEEDMIVGKNFLDRPGLKIIKRFHTFELEDDIIQKSKDDETNNSSILKINNLVEIKENEINIGMNIPEITKNALLLLVNNYRDCFAKELQELGKTSVEELKINLKDNTVVKYRPYKVPYALKPVLDKMIKELLELKVIQPSSSEYSSPVMLVKKKEGDFRMCVDYRKLNSITKRENFPVPNIEETLNSLANKAVFTSLDLLSGYYQIKVADESRHLTSFVTPNGQYEFIRMPFGLTNSPAVFMRMMAKVLNPIKSENIIVYMDDILIATKTIEENMNVLENFLEILRKAGLTLKLEKCTFFQESIQFLGHDISAEGIKPGQLKTSAIQNYKVPKNPKEIRQFLGLAGYFRRFIQNYSLIAHPLNKLTRKNAEFIWSAEANEAFETLKLKLSSKPLLSIYDVNKQHELHTDASSLGIAGVLMQMEADGTLKPVSYFSRSTTSYEEKYHSYELEALAVVESLERFKFYLLNKHFKVVTDCLSLKLTQTKKDIIPRIARWWLRILEYSFDLEFRPGSKLRHADALSRAPNGEAVEPQSVADKVFIISLDVKDWISTLQYQDPKLNEIRSVLDGSTKEHSEEHVIKKNYVLKDDKLYKKTDSGEKFVVPSGLKWRIIKTAHDDMGHCGQTKTLSNIRKTFWFSNMTTTVKKYLKSCIECAYNKRGENENKYTIFEPERQPVPFYTIHIDHLGPFPKSKGRNEYIIGIVDSFTKFIILKAVKSTCTKWVIKLLDEITQYFGLPTRIVTDRGSSFTSKEFEKYCSENVIKHVKTAVKTPRANGQVERYFRTVKSSINAMTEKGDGKDWDKHVTAIQWALNSSQHSTTKQTPQELLMDYKPKSILKNKLILALHDNTRKDGEEEDVPLSQIRQMALERIKKNQSIQAERHNSKRQPPEQFEVGDLVMVKREPVTTGEPRKVQPRYKGPYQIRQKLGNDRYLITDPDSIQLSQKPYESVHSAEHLKKWITLVDADFDIEIISDDENEDLEK